MLRESCSLEGPVTNRFKPWNLGARPARGSWPIIFNENNKGDSQGGFTTQVTLQQQVGNPKRVKSHKELSTIVM